MQKKAITKLSKLSVGSLSAIDKLETQLNESRRDGVGPKSGSTSNGGGGGNDERITKLEADFHKLARLYKGSQDVLGRLESRSLKLKRAFALPNHS